MTAARSRKSSKGVRVQDPDGTRKNIIDVATQEFAENGLSGARIDEIAAKTRGSKRMIYYYFGDKSGLYLSVLEEAYRRVRVDEATLNLDGLDPAEAIRELVRFTFDHHNTHESFIRLVMIENIHHGEYLSRSEVIKELNVTAIDTVSRILERGVAQGLFRTGIDPVELHWQISALCFFNVSNRATFSQIFGEDLSAPDRLERLRNNCVEMVLSFVRKPQD